MRISLQERELYNGQLLYRDNWVACIELETEMEKQAKAYIMSTQYGNAQVTLTLNTSHPIHPFITTLHYFDKDS